MTLNSFPLGTVHHACTSTPQYQSAHQILSAKFHPFQKDGQG